MAGAEQSGIPVNTGVVEDAGTPDSPSFVFAQPWFYLFQAFWRKLGGQYSSPQTMVYGQQTGAKEVTFYSANTGALIGKVTLT